jgi:hypothetical protein
MELEEQLHAQQGEIALDDQEQGPPLLDANSFINVSSSSSEDITADIPRGLLLLHLAFLLKHKLQFLNIYFINLPCLWEKDY